MNRIIRFTFIAAVFAICLGILYSRFEPELKNLYANYQNQKTLAKILDQPDSEAAEILKTHKIDPNLQNDNGDSLLIWSVSKNMNATSNQLINMGADPNLADREGLTPLMYAVLNGNFALAKQLAEKGAKLDHRDNAGRSLLFFAVQHPGTGILDWLLEQGSDPNVEDNRGRTALHFAVEWHAIGAVDRLLESGADLMALDHKGDSPLSLMELSPYFGHYLERKSVAEKLPNQYVDMLPEEDYGSSPPPRWDLNELQRLVHQKINEERRNFGLEPYAYASDLERLARIHSDDMAKRNFFSHHNPEGESPTDRADRVGVSTRVVRGPFVHLGVAENLFMGSVKQSIAFFYEKGVRKQTIHWHTMESMASAIVSGWMNSPGHRKNVLSPNHQEHGIGVAISNELKLYASQEMR